jgi:hypothetical protein
MLARDVAGAWGTRLAGDCAPCMAIGPRDSIEGGYMWCISDGTCMLPLVGTCSNQ